MTRFKEKGGAVIGINTDTLNGDNSMIEEAKKILMSRKPATETCILTAIQVTPWILQTASLLSRLHLVDRGGYIVGDPVVGSIDDESTMKMLRKAYR